MMSKGLKAVQSSLQRHKFIIRCKQFRGAFSGDKIHFLRRLRREDFSERLSLR